MNRTASSTDWTTSSAAMMVMAVLAPDRVMKPCCPAMVACCSNYIVAAGAGEQTLVTEQTGQRHGNGRNVGRQQQEDDQQHQPWQGSTHHLLDAHAGYAGGDE